MKAKLCIGFLSLGVVWFSNSLADTLPPDSCKQEYEKIIHPPHRTSSIMKLNYWRALKGKCGGTGSYQYRLGRLHIQHGDLHGARVAFNKGLALKADYHKELLLGLADADKIQGNLGGAEISAKKIIHDYPEWYGGYEEMGGIEIQRGKFAAAIPYLENAVKRNDKDWLSHGRLAVAYQKTGQHKQSITSFEKAFGLNKYGVSSQRDMMLSGASSYIKLDKLGQARSTLTLLKKKSPIEARDPNFIKMMDEVEQGLKHEAKNHE